MSIGALSRGLWALEPPGFDWQWALNGGTTLSHGWTPESGFLPCRWDAGYSEAVILYVVALGSPTFPIDPRGYVEWTSTFEWLDKEYL